MSAFGMAYIGLLTKIDGTDMAFRRDLMYNDGEVPRPGGGAPVSVSMEV